VPPFDFSPFAFSHHVHEVPPFEWPPTHHLMVSLPFSKVIVDLIALEKLAPS
jgi:hypothetical protein